MNVRPNAPTNVLEKFSFPVPSRPIETANPPAVPPQRVALDLDPIPLEVRRLRVAHGSRRKRDLAAVAMAEELEQLERLAAAGPADCRAVLRAWVGVRRDLRRSLPRSTYLQWLRPLRPVGADGTTLLLTAPDNVRAWVERRYTALIGEALRESSDFTAVQFVPSGEAR